MSKEWEIKQISEIADVKGGKRVPNGYKLLSDKTIHPYITVSDFTESGSIDTERVRYISDEVFSQIKNYTIRSYDVFLSIAGTIGKAGSVPRELDGANLTENACKLVLKGLIHKEFLLYFTQSSSFIDQVALQTRTAAQPKLALERLKTISIPIPPLPEQKRIVKILDEAFAGIATVKANAEKNLKNARAVFDGKLHSFFGTVWQEDCLVSLVRNCTEHF